MSDAIATKSGTKISPSYISEAILDIGNYDGNLLTDKQKELFSDAIFDCAVVGVDDPKNDDSEQYKVPVAHIAIKDGYEGKVEEELLKILPLYIKERIDSKHMPYDYKFWKEKDFPYTPAKKIDTTKLKKLGTLKK